VALIGWAILVGASLVAGALVAVVLRLPERIAAVVTSFGGGLLVAAIAFELVPEADERAGAVVTALGLLAGTLVYVGADAWLTRDEAMAEIRRSGQAAAAGQPMTMSVDHAEAARGESIAVGLFVDGVPESIALGLTVAEGEIGLALLVGIVVGNVVEAYGAAQPIITGGHTKRFAVVLLGGIGLALAGAAILGGTVLADTSDDFVGGAQALAAGAVLAVDLGHPSRLRRGVEPGRNSDRTRLHRRLPTQLTAPTARARADDENCRGARGAELLRRRHLFKASGLPPGSSWPRRTRAGWPGESLSSRL
jgi:ZIP family zinc transporter